MGSQRVGHNWVTELNSDNHEEQHEVMVKGFSALLDMRRCKDQAHSISLKISNSLNTCFVVSFQCTESSLLVFTPNSLQGVWTASAAAPRSLILTEVEGKCQWQAPVCSWHLVNAAAIAEGTSQNTISTCSRGWAVLWTECQSELHMSHLVDLFFNFDVFEYY